MSIEEFGPLIFGCLSAVIGIALALAKVDREALAKKTHTNPGLALFRFPAWKYGAAAALVFLGIVVLVTSY